MSNRTPGKKTPKLDMYSSILDENAKMSTAFVNEDIIKTMPIIGHANLDILLNMNKKLNRILSLYLRLSSTTSWNHYYS